MERSPHFDDNVNPFEETRRTGIESLRNDAPWELVSSYSSTDYQNGNPESLHNEYVSTPYDQFKRTSRHPSTWADAERSRDFLVGIARHRGTAEDLKKVERWPYTPPEVLGYLHPFDEGGFNPALIGKLYEPWTDTGVVPRIYGPHTWGSDKFKVGFDVNLGDPFGLGGKALIDYNVSPSTIKDMSPLLGNSDRDIAIKYQVSLDKIDKILDWFGGGNERSIDDLDDLSIPPFLEWE